MASIEIALNNSVSREQLRMFHLTGRGLDEFRPRDPLRPACLEQLELPRLEHSYPLYLAPAEPPQPFFRLLQAVVDAHPAKFPILRDRLEAVAEAFGQQAGSRECVSLSSLLEGALAAVRTRLELLPVDSQAAQKECEALRKALPAEGWLIGFGDGALTLLSCATLKTARREARVAFARELRQYGQRLQELLALDDRNSASESSSDRLAASLGARATSFLDVSALAGSLQRRVNPTLPVDPERRARCESALATIRDAISGLDQLPQVILIHSGRAPEIPPHFAIEYRQAADACDSALSLCRRQLNHYVPVWKALRVARLEVESAFDPAIHAAALDGFDWSMARPDELAALPVVMVVETAQQIEQSLASFARVLQSGLPVQVLIACPNVPAGNLACLPIAYQEAFALHSSIAATGHLIGSLSEMARTLRPAVAIVGTGEAWIPAALLPLARVCPLYRYHPDLGESWYERFTLQTDRPAQYERLTFAHAAALMPVFRSHFRIFPDVAGPLDRAELVEYPADRPPQAFPFLFVTDENGQQSRAVFTRELADACSAARRRWRFLAELAAPKAAAVVKEADPDAENRLRLDGATQAIHRAISILTNTGSSG
jgi:hypothetical protein